MNRTLWAALACVGGLAGGVTGAAEPSVCAQLAGEARRLPATVWDKSEPLARWIRPSRPTGRTRSPTEQALANDAYLRELLTAPSAEHVGVHHLQGTPLYLLDFLTGTAHCQQYALAEVRQGQLPKELASPFQPTAALCMGGWARLARVMNRPALVAGAAPSAGFPEGEYRVAVWTGRGWEPPCGLKLRLRTVLTLVQRFCAPGSAVCGAGQAVALGLATASEAAGAAEAGFAARQPDDEVLAALNPPLQEPGAVGDPNLPLPTFGAKDGRRDGFLMQFSNAAGERLPVFIDGRWWLAVVGRAGIGWRTGAAVNVAFFAPPGRAVDAVASYQFGIEPAGLLDATAVDEPR